MTLFWLAPGEELDYFLYVLQDNESINSFDLKLYSYRESIIPGSHFEKPKNKLFERDHNWVVMYPDPNEESTVEPRSYKAGFIINTNILKDSDNKLVEVSMGPHLLDKGPSFNPELIKFALEKINRKVPKYIQEEMDLIKKLDKFTASHAPDDKVEAKGQTLGFFEKSTDFLNQEVVRLAEHILRGEEQDVRKVLDRLRKYPKLLEIEVTAIDPHGTPVKGKLLQIAAMAGDFNLKPDIKDENKRGMVESILEIGYLSNEAVNEQLKCIYSEEAKQINASRIKRYEDIVIEFGNAICTKYVKGMSEEEFNRVCKDHINELQERLNAERKKEVSAGLIFPTTILAGTACWFKQNAKQFGNWRDHEAGNLFWVKAFGKLQSKLAARDTQILQHNLDTFLSFDESIPVRELQTDKKLGEEFYLGIYGPSLSELHRYYVHMAKPFPELYESLDQIRSQEMDNLGRKYNKSLGVKLE